MPMPKKQHPPLTDGQSALAALWLPLAYRLVNRRVFHWGEADADPHLAEDMAHEAVMRAARLFDPTLGKFGTLLDWAVRSVATERMRRILRAREVQPADGGLADVPARGEGHDSDRLESVAAEVEGLRLLVAAEDWDLLWMVHAEGVRRADAGERLGVPWELVKEKLKRARAKLRGRRPKGVA